MISISDFKVVVKITDMSAMVTSMQLYESIHGNVKGILHVEDKLGFFDHFFAGAALTPVEISYTYLTETCNIDMYIDGVTDQVINKMGKSYNVTLSSALNLNTAVTRICNSYSGTSNDILQLIWNETHGEQELKKDSVTISKGKYVVPNISADECINNIVNTAYDENKTGMFLYQRLADGGKTRFTSIHTMNNNVFKPAGTPFVIRNEELTLENATGLHGTIGTSTSFVLKEYNRDFIAKLAGGLWGSKITEIALDESTNKVQPVQEFTDIEKTKFSLSKTLYSYKIGTDGDISSPKSLFTPDSSVSEEMILNMKYRLFNTLLAVNNVVAIPNLGCGMTIFVDQGNNGISATRSNGKYLVANITHNYIMDDGEMNYSQNLNLVREGDA